MAQDDNSNEDQQNVQSESMFTAADELAKHLAEERKTKKQADEATASE